MEAIRARIDQIILINYGERAARRMIERIGTVTDAIQRASASLEYASTTCAEADYKKALQEMKRTGKIIEEYQAEREEGKKPLITEAEYLSLSAEITGELSEICRADKLAIIDLCEQIQEIAARNDEAIREGNELLRSLQGKVYKYADCEKDKSGAPVLAGSEKHFTDEAPISAWIDQAINENAAYNAMEKSAEKIIKV